MSAAAGFVLRQLGQLMNLFDCVVDLGLPGLFYLFIYHHSPSFLDAFELKKEKKKKLHRLEIL